MTALKSWMLRKSSRKCLGALHLKWLLALMRAFQTRRKKKIRLNVPVWRRLWTTWDCCLITPITDIKPDKIFIGSCTNARIEDLRAAAEVLRGKTISSSIRQALVVPGSGLVRQQAEKEGLRDVFLNAGFEWRRPGCSMCLGMNEDQVGEEERCASTSNRNFEGRQGRKARTHLLSPAMAAAAAAAGHFVDISRQ